MAHTFDIADDNILYATITGVFADEEMQVYMSELAEILEGVPEGEQLKSFTDTTQLERVNPSLRRSIGEFMDNPKFGKTAVLGNSRVVKVMIDFAMTARGKHYMRYFTDRDEAMAWLQEDS